MKIIIYNKEFKNYLVQLNNFKLISIENKENPFLIMSNLKDCNELHLLAHGSPGHLDLGTGINIEALNENAEYLSTLNVQKIILWGCHVGKNTEFIKIFSKLTNMTVYASKDYLGKNKGMSNEFPEMNDFIKSLPFYLSEKKAPLHSYSQSESCPGDDNDDGVVNIFELLNVIENWGCSTEPETEPEPEPESFFSKWQNYDNIINYLNTMGYGGTSIGKTYQQNNIFVYKKGIGSAKPIIVIIGTQHAREWISPLSCVYILKEFPESLLDFYEIHIIPVVNVDGYKHTWNKERYWRKNRQPCSVGSSIYGTDLNRNWGFQWGLESGSSSNCNNQTYRGASAFSSPEIKAVSNYILNLKDRLCLFIDVHSYSAALGGIWGYTVKNSYIENIQEKFCNDAVQAMNQVNNSPSNYYEYWTTEDIYLVSGSSCDWVFNECDAWSFYYEIRPETPSKGGFDPPETDIIKGAKESLAGLISLAININGKKPSETNINIVRKSSKPIRKKLPPGVKRHRCGEENII